MALLFLIYKGVLMIHPIKSIALIAALSVTLSACGEKKATGQSDVAVKVNGEAISVTELEDKMRQLGHLRGAQKITVSESVIKSQIDMELLRQAAVKESLDADKSIRARLAESNRLILATAYLEKKMAAIAKPGEAEVKAYFNQHPERYAERKQYDLQELRIQTRPDNAAQIREKLGSGKSSKEFVRWMKGKKIPYIAQQIVTSADQMPEEILQKLKNIKSGEAIAIDGKDQLNVIFVTAVKSQPVTLEQASQQIVKALDDRRKRDGMNDMLKQLREKAKIEYVPPYTANGIAVSGNE